MHPWCVPVHPTKKETEKHEERKRKDTEKEEYKQKRTFELWRAFVEVAAEFVFNL